MSEWISVEDRLPEHQHMVLCYMPLAYNGYRGIHYGWLQPELNFKGHLTGRSQFRAHSPFSYAHRMEDEKFTGTMGSKVTHWMPLPEPPK